MRLKDSLKEKFIDIVGKSNISTSNAQLKKNSTDATKIKSNPILVIWPRNKQQVLEIIKIANKENVSIVPRGGGSGLCGGVTANNSVVLNMTKMSKIIKINKKNKYTVTQSGIFLDKLNKKIHKQNLFFPAQPASHKIATIGGMVSTNAGGERALKFGNVSKNILELEVVTGNGKLLKINKSKIKDFCGTEGLMGIVVEIKLKLLPIIKQTSMTIYEVDTIEDVIKLVKKSIKDKNLIACEFIDSKVHKMMGLEEKYFLLLEHIGKKDEIKNKKQIKKFWKIREECFPFLFKKGWKFIADPKIPIKNMEKFLLWCDKNNLPAYGHIGHGIMHTHYKNTRKMEEMYKLVKKLHGDPSGEHGFGILKKKYLPNKRKVELKKLKQKYDNKNILNPGKII